MDYKVYKRRYLFLFLFSMSSLFNMMICFTFSPIADQSILFYGSNFPINNLISIFFIVYCITTFPASRFIQVMGLRNSIILGSWLQAIGCGIRCLSIQESGHSGSMDMVILGQTIAALGQSFFLNPPATFTATWFPESERTFATNIACNSSNLGIAAAYIISPLFVTKNQYIPYLLQFLALITTGTALVITFLFEDRPPSPPSYSAAKKHRMDSESLSYNTVEVGALSSSNSLDDLDEVDESVGGVEFTYLAYLFCDSSLIDNIKILFTDTGFLCTLIAFCTAEVIITGFSTFINQILIPEGFSAYSISIIGSLFIIFSLVGSTFFSFIADKYKNFKTVVLISLVYFIFTSFINNFSGCLSAMIGFMLLLSIHNLYLISILLILIGFFIGSIQPIVIEVTADCTFPISENVSTSMLQFMANISSSCVIPIMSAIQSNSTIYKAIWLLISFVCVSGITYSLFNANYKRSHDEADQQSYQLFDRDSLSLDK